MMNLTPQPNVHRTIPWLRNLLEWMLLKQYCCRFEKISFH
jgi:hypothetical protein